MPVQRVWSRKQINDKRITRSLYEACAGSSSLKLRMVSFPVLWQGAAFAQVCNEALWGEPISLVRRICISYHCTHFTSEEVTDARLSGNCGISQGSLEARFSTDR